MPLTPYHKIVRDNIPDLIAKTGAKVQHRVMPVDDFARLLRQKLVEEANEVVGAQTYEALVSELGDILDVVQAIQQIVGVPDVMIREARDKKQAERGGFDKRIFLETVED